MPHSAHVDTFARDRLPEADRMPVVLLDHENVRYPDVLNAVSLLLDAHVERGDGARRCIVAPGSIDLTYADVQNAANRIAGVLTEELGVVPGSRVLLRAPNTPMLAACWLAVLKAGAIAVSTMPLYRATELRNIIEKAQVDVALCDARLGSELRAVIDPGGIPIVYFGSGEPDGLEARMDAQSDRFRTVETGALDVAMIAFTSGTTGAPKAAMHYHRDLLASCDTYARDVLQPHRDDLFAGSPPLAFTYGLGGLLLFPMYAGAATLLLEKAGPEDMLQAVDERGVTTLFTAPIAYRAMAPLVDRYDIRTLRTCVSAGETLPKPVWDAWYAKTGIKILDGIGSTEMLHIFIGSPVHDVRPGSTGRVVPGYSAEIHDDDGRPLPPGSVGRLAVRGPTGCKYLDDPRQATYVQDGWNYPGDAYRMDDDGYFWYVARTDDMIISAGFNIAGPEVEQALLAHADILECAVVGKPDPAHDTNIVKAFVVLREPPDDVARKAQELIEFCKAQIAAFKAPREVEFVAALPRTQTGKVQRFKLRERESAGDS
ncbi:MAG: AMP-binding protein [Vulcanimicrobiaceae bacterium]